MANVDYSTLSDEELDALIAGEAPAPKAPPQSTGEFIKQGFAAGKGKSFNAPPPEDNTMGMPGWQLGLAGAGGEMNELLQGAKEKAQIAFAPPGDEGAKLRAAIAAERAQRKAVMQKLYANPEAVAGQMAAKILPAIAAPARLPAQMALEGGLEMMKAGAPRPTGLPSEMAGSLVRGAEGAGTVGVLGKGMQMAGKTAGALAGRTTDEGATALRAREAARNLGIPAPTVGQLYPSSPMATIDRAMPGHDELLLSQAKALRSAVDDPLRLPEGDVPNVGGAFKNELADAVQQRYAIAAEKYKAVDDIVASKGLGGLMPIYTARSVTATNAPGYEVAADLLTRYGFDAASVAGQSANALGKMPLQFSNYQTMRVAVNKSLNTLDRGIATAERMGASIPKENVNARKWLSDLKTAMDNDAERWAKTNADNREAVDAFKDATAYFRDVVAPTVIENPVARRAATRRGGYATGEAALRGATSNEGMPFLGRLYPTMTRRGQDMTDVLRNLPDVRTTALSKDMTVPSTAGGLGQVARAAMGHPLTAAQMAMSHVPGLQGLTRSAAAHRLAAAPDLVTGATPAIAPSASLRARLAPAQGAGRRSAWGLLQYPQQSAEEYTQSILQNR